MLYLFFWVINYLAYQLINVEALITFSILLFCDNRKTKRAGKEGLSEERNGGQPGQSAAQEKQRDGQNTVRRLGSPWTRIP